MNEAKSEKEKSRQEEIESLRQEIREYAEKEESGEIKTAHFLGGEFDPNRLTDEDLLIWQKISAGTIAESEFDMYQDGVYGGEERDDSDIEISRSLFLAFLRNRAAVIFGRRQLEEMRKKDEKTQ